MAERAFLVCATPRSGSTLVCQALRQTDVAGRPEEYFEALRHSGRPRRPEEYFLGLDDPSILDQLGERSGAEESLPRSWLWSRSAYDRYLAWAINTGTTPNGVFSAKLMWGYFEDFVGLLRTIPRYRDLALVDILPAVFGEDLTYVRVVRANKIRQAVSLWKAIQTANWRQDDGGTFHPDDCPEPCFNFRAIAHLLQQILAEEASWDAYFEHSGVRPTLVLYENFAADPRTSTLNILERLGLEAPSDVTVHARMKRQSDGINDDWVRRFSERRLGNQFDLVRTVLKPMSVVL
jgi:LPS sulfotransferase NodH